MHEHAGGQREIRVRQHGADAKGARYLADPGIDRSDLAAEGAPRECGARGGCRLARAYLPEEQLGHAELDLDLGQIVERGQHGIVVDAGAEIDPAHAGHPGERRLDGAIGQPLARRIDARAGAGISRLELVHGRLGDGVVRPQLLGPLQRQLGLAQPRLRLGDRRALRLVVETHEHRARLDPLARAERDLRHPAGGERDDVHGLAGERGADRLDALAQGAGFGNGDLDRYRVRPAIDRGLGFAVGLGAMIEEPAGGDGHHEDCRDRGLGA